jgi:hypothetical protein
VSKFRSTRISLLVISFMVGLTVAGCRSIPPQQGGTTDVKIYSPSTVPELTSTPRPSSLPTSPPAERATATQLVSTSTGLTKEQAKETQIRTVQTNSPTEQALAAQFPPTPTEQPLPSSNQMGYIPPLLVWGIEMNYVDSNGLNFVAQSGAFWVRRNGLIWSEVEPEEGMREWQAAANLENELKSVSAEGKQVILVVRSTPDWAQSLPDSFCSPPNANSLEAFASFLYDAVRRYSLPPYNVQYWEIGNEPDISASKVLSDAPFGCWGAEGDPYYGGQYYAEILKSVYPQIKSANPQSQVLVGGLLLDCDPVNSPETEPGSGKQKDCTSSRYLEGILENGGGAYFDGISFHAYDYFAGNIGEYSNTNWNSAWDSTGPVSIAKANFIRGILNLYGISGKYLLNTELALLCGRDGSEPVCQSDGFNLTKAYYLAQSYTTAIAEHLQANIWYSLTGWRGSGLLDSSLQPNQAFMALQTSANILEGVEYIGPITAYPGVRGYAFVQDGVPVWVLWSLDGSNHVVQLDQVPSSVTGVFGEMMGTSQNLTITLAPVYIKFGK